MHQVNIMLVSTPPHTGIYMFHSPGVAVEIGNTVSDDVGSSCVETSVVKSVHGLK